MLKGVGVLHLSNGYQIDLYQSARLVKWLDLEKPERWDKHSTAKDLGLPYVTVRYLSGLTAAMGLIDQNNGKLTRLGQTLLDADPYLSTICVCWVVHFNLASNPRHIVWYRLANNLVCSRPQFGLQDAKMMFSDLLDSYAVRSLGSHLSDELRVFFHAYSEGALSGLGYLREQDGAFVAPASLRVPPVVFVYSLLTFAARYRSGETAIPISDIANAPSSPGRILLMSESDLRAHLEKMHRKHIITVENRAHLDQVRFVNPPDPADYLRDHFKDMGG